MYQTLIWVLNKIRTLINKIKTLINWVNAPLINELQVQD